MKEVTNKNFNDLVLKSTKPVMVDFWAEWCGPCRMLSPILEQLSSEQSNVEIMKCNVDENPELSAAYGIKGIPTVLTFQNGNVIDKHVGMATKATFQNKIGQL